MAQTNTAYDPDADKEPVHHRSPAEEQELHDFRRAMGISPEEEAQMDDRAVHDDGGGQPKQDGLFNADGDSGEEKSSGATGAGAAEATTAAVAGASLFKADEDEGKNPKRKKVKSALQKLTKKKGLMVAGGGGGVIALLVIFLLLFASSLKIPDLMQNITAYEFARLTRQFGDNADQVTDEDLALESINTVENPTELSYLGEKYANAVDMWSKLDNYRPSQVIKTLGTDNDMQLTVSPKGGITGTLDDVPFSMADPGASRVIPGLRFATGFSDQVQFAREFAPALEDALEVNEVGPIIRGIVANDVRKQLGIGLIAWHVGKYKGENDQQARLTEEQEKLDAIDGGDTPPAAPGDVDELNNDEEAVDKAAAAAEGDDSLTSTTGLEEVINNGGIIKGVTTAVGTALQGTPFEDFVELADPIAKFATPACIIFDGSLDNSGGSIDNQTKQQQSAFYYLASAADQQKDGSNASIDNSGDGLDAAIGATNDDVGDITQSNAYIRATGGTVNTSNVVSAESSADGQFTFFDAIPGLSSIPLVLPFLNATAGTFCPTLTNAYVQGVIGIASILANFIPGVDASDEATQIEAREAGEQLTDDIITPEADALADSLVTNTQVITKEVSTATKVKTMLIGGAKNALAIGGLTILAKLIVLNRAGAVNSGTAQGTDLANEADSGGNIQANELERTQLFGRPMSEDEVCISNQNDQTYIADNESKESAFNRYLAPSNTDSLLDRTAVAMGGEFNGSLGSTMLRLSSDLLHPMSLIGSMSSLIFGRALAATNCASVSTDYGNVQFGWSNVEEAIIKSSTSYNPIENEEIVDDSGQEAAIAAKYAVCFGYTYNPNGDGSFDPTDANGDLKLADGPGEPASLGTLLSSDGMGGKTEYIERDKDGNVLDDPTKALCSPSNLDQDNDTYGPEMVMRWRLNMEDDTTVDQLTNEQSVN